MDSQGFKNAKKREKTVSRAYGGSRCHLCVRQRYEPSLVLTIAINRNRQNCNVRLFFGQHRVVRAFLIEEQKIVKKVLAEKSKKPKKSDA